MSKTDWIEVGLRLLGVFFIVSGIGALWRTVVVMAVASGRGIGDASMGATALMIPLVELGAGIALLFIRWPGDATAHGAKSSQRKPLPEHLQAAFPDVTSSA